MAVKVFTFDDKVTAELEGGFKAAVTSEDIASFCAEVYDFYRKQNHRGYIRKADVQDLTPQVVEIPQNFAGLEAVMVPTRLQEQLFRIVDVVENEGFVTITARHVWYDNLKNYTLWKPTETTKYSGANACRNILENAISGCPSRVASDCKDEIIGKDLDYERKNLVEAFLDPEDGVCAKYGLSLIRDNWDFFCLKEVGYDRGMVIQDGKNLLGVERHENIDDVATRVAPYGKDEQGNIVWLNNNGSRFVDSENIGDYTDSSHPMVELYDTGLQYGKDDITARNIQAKLLEAGQKRFTEDHIDEPLLEMTIQFLSLGDTEEYAQYRDLDKVYLFDILTIKDTVRGYSYTAQVVGVEHDILTGMLLSVTIGQLDNWDGVRKIPCWQVPEISGENIRLKSIMAGAYADGSIFGDAIADRTIRGGSIIAHDITADEIKAGTITADEIAAGTITTNELDTENLAAGFANISVLNNAIATIADAEIETANISYAQIKDASVDNLIARDATTDRYFIHKLQVENAQLVTATVGQLIVKAADDHYYRLDIDQNGQLTPTDVTSTLTSAEKTAGVTGDGKSTIIETDLVAADLSATNMKAINALIDKLTASRIDVSELFARTATINELNAVDIRGNTYLQLMVAGYGTTYNQWTDPATEQGNTVKNGDVWYRTAPVHTYSEMESLTWSQLESYTYKSLEGYTEYIRKNGAWVTVNDPAGAQILLAQMQIEMDRVAILVSDSWTGIAQIRVRVEQIALTVQDKYGMVSGIEITSAGVDVSGSKHINLDVDANTYVHISSAGIDMKGSRVNINGCDVWARDDIIVMNPNATDVWRRTVAGIESHMSGRHDWVMIRPFYDSSITYVGATGGAQAGTAINNQYTESGSSGKAFGGQATWYNYAISLNLQNTASVYRQLTVQVFLANKPFSFQSGSADRRADAAAQANVILPEVTGTIGANNTLTLALNSGHVGYNLCGENQKVYYYIYGLNYEGMNVTGNTLTATDDATNGRVPCTTYYYN